MVLDKEAVKIAEGQNTLIFYQEGNGYGQPVIVKVLKDEYNFYPHTTQIYNEDEHVRELKIKGIRSSLDRLTIDNKPALILEYFNGNTLKDFIRNGQASFVDKLKIAISICDTLGKIHDEGIIHKDFNSYNILIDEHHEVNIIDFGLSTKLNTKPDVKTASEYLEGTLPYISPEQTGRVNHVVDQRSDLYSLGVLMYELFTGDLPFTSEDPMELVHSHLALMPVPLFDINSDIPKVTSDIVMKLLSKNLETRYQTAQGVLADLQKCYNQLNLKIDIREFEIAQEDQSGKFLIPSKLYGRDKEKELLLNAFENIGKSNEITLIDGYSGTGKTSLIYELHKPLTRMKGNFIHGKHEQFQKDIPYHAIIQAFKGLINLLLSEKEENLQKWKESIKAAVGKEGKLLTDLIPNLELIIGPQCQLEELGINENKHRFDYIFLRFIKAIATSDHPLILFIDDLQWADAASLHLLKKIICDEELKYFYFVGAYRGNEVDDSHPTSLIIDEIKNNDVKINAIRLNELKLVDIRYMISDTLLIAEDDCYQLARIIHSKTAGNPFFVHQFLISMHENGLITYEKSSGWKFDIDNIKQMNFTDNVVEFIIGKIETLDQDPIDSLKLSSCIGDTFDLETLVSISEKSEHDVVVSIYKLVKEQFLVMQGGNPDFMHLQSKYGNDNDRVPAFFKFSHDRIRQAAYAMVPEGQKSAWHLKIGTLMLQNIPDKSREEKIFDLVFQLNNGIDLISSAKEKLRLSRLNYEAAEKARSSSAYQKSLFHYETSLSLLSASQKIDHSFLMTLLNGAMQCAYLVGNYKRMDELYEEIKSKSDGIIDEVDAYRIVILSYIARNRFKDATNFGLEALRKLNVRFPAHPNKLQILSSFVKTKFALRKKNASYFASLPPIKDQKVLAVLKIIISFASAAYHNTPELFPLVVMKMMRMSLKYGNSSDLISTYGGYGILLCGITGEMEEGYAYGQESLKMLDSFENSRHASARTLVIYTTFINHWKDHLNASFPLLMRSYYDAMETGDHEFAAGSLFVHSYHSFIYGESLSTLVPRMDSHHRKICQLNQKSYEYYNTIGYQAIKNLYENSADPTILKGEIFDEDDFFENKDANERHIDKTALFHYHFYKTALHYLSGNFEEAHKHCDKIRDLDVAMSTALIPAFTFYDSLVALELYQNASKSDQPALLKRIRSNQQKFKKWARHSPINYQHKYDIIQAKLCHIQNENREVVTELFERCISSAIESRYNNDLAIAYEFAAKYFASIGDKENETQNIKRAFLAYQQWGVDIKQRKIKNEYNALFRNPEDEISISKSRSYVSISTGNFQLDLATVMKASSAIMGEIKMNKLLHQLLKILTENAGAQSGTIILNEDGLLKIKARLDEHGEIVFPDCYNEEQNNVIPAGIVQYVYRTKDDIVLKDAQSDERFSQDEYIQEKKCLSVLCMPIMSKKKLIGIIHLENNLVTGAFTRQRIELLKMLSGQIAISIENSLLYDRLEQKVIERTREIDEQKEELKVKNAELVSINKEKDDLINVVSHDLRSPLNQVKGLAQIIAMETGDKNIKEYGGKIMEAIDRLNSMITRILDVSAIEAQKIEIKREKFDVTEQVRFVVDSFRQNAKNKDIRLGLSNDEEGLSIEVDKNYFIQIMENLLSNAVKYTYEKGQVNVVITAQSGEVVVEVRDTGPGISEMDQKMLFSKFQKLSAKPTAGEKSTGLGLAIVKRYTDAMGGKIWCESELYKGTSFFVSFPGK